jgi:hypothetical protein
MKQEILDAFFCLELELSEVAAELVHRGLLDPIAPHLDCPDRLPRLCGGLLESETRLHFLWHHTQQGGECTSIITVVVGVELDGIPKPGGLQIHPHHQCPLGVVGVGECGVDDCR